VEVYGVKSESLVTVLWVRDSTGFTSIGHGGIVETGNSGDPRPYPYMGPDAIYRFTNSTGFVIANTVDQTYICADPSSVVFDGTDGEWENGVLHAVSRNVSTAPFEWPVYYGRGPFK